MMGGSGRVEIDVDSLLMKRQQIIGSTLARAIEGGEGGDRGRFLQRFGEDLRAGRVRPVIDRVFPLEKAAEAHRRMKTNEHFGKIVLRVA